MTINHIRLRCGILAVCMVLGACSKDPQVFAETPLPEASPRNLLLICIDTVRADVFYGLGEAHKDSLSAWQDDALVFEQAISSSSWTVPALGSVFSGLWQSGHGGGRLPDVNIGGLMLSTALNEGVPLLAEAAEQEGFDTAALSASPWTNSPDDAMGLTRGFKEKQKLGRLGSRAAFGQMNAILAQKLEDTPFFYYLHFMEAHDWHVTAEPVLDARIAKFSPEERALFLQVAPPQACKDEQSLLCKRYLVYASAVKRLRESIAAMLTRMEEKGLLEDTVVVVFSDHGEEFGDHANDKRIQKTVGSSPNKFVGHGQSMYQELLHVPIIVWHPKYDGAGIDELVSLVDIGPTVARWLDIEFLPAQWPGYYLDNYLQPSQKSLERVAYASGIANGEQQISAQQGTRKSIWYMVSDENSYFDLASDPYESHSAPRDNFVLRFDGLFLDYARSMQNKERKPALLTDEQIRKLQSIGYLQGVETSADTEN
jgi:arylsulfatase A-like enzyme